LELAQPWLRRFGIQRFPGKEIINPFEIKEGSLGLKGLIPKPQLGTLVGGNFNPV